MDCQEAKRMLFKYVDQELSLSEEKALNAHLHVCSNCASEFDQAYETHNLLYQAMVPVEPPVDLTERIMAAYDREVENQNSAAVEKSLWKNIITGWRSFIGSWQWKAAAVACCMMAVVLWSNKAVAPGPQLAVNNPSELHGQVDNVPQESDNVPAGGQETEPPSVQEPDNSKPVVPDKEDDPDQGTKTAPSKDPVKPKENVASPGSKQVIQLPQSTSGQTKLDSMEVVPLVENENRTAYRPALLGHDQTVYFLMEGDGSKEVWQVEMSEGAVAQKAPENTVLPGEDQERETVKGIPAWLSELEDVKKAVSVIYSWSPDQRNIAVNLGPAKDSGIDESTGKILLVRADGSQIVEGAKSGGGSSLVWSSDGTKVAFTDGFDYLYVLYVREGVLLQVTDSSNSFQKIGKLLWTPDHKKIIFEGQKNSKVPAGIYMARLP